MANDRLNVKLPRGVTLNDPILLASGCCGYGEEYSELVDPSTIGGVITKAVSLEPRAGNRPPRIWETPSGMLNCIGLQNPGIEVFCADVVPRLLEQGFSFMLNVVGHKAVEFAQLVERLETELGTYESRAGFLGYELDLSCPNVASGTMFATDLALLKETTRLARVETTALLVAKLSPNVTHIAEYASAAQQAGADAVTVANTWAGVSIDISTRRSRVVRPSAGLSGPAIRAATLYQVWQCHKALPELPILASGGITDTDSAVQFLLAGATCLQIGTGLFLNPMCPKEILAGLVVYLDEQGVGDVEEIIGTYDDSV